MMPFYFEEKLLGAGKFGEVWLVKSSLNSRNYVVKEIPLDSVATRQQITMSEVAILSKCNHKNIIRYKEASIDEIRRKLSIVMEYAEGGDLAAAIRNQRGIYFTEKRILSWFSQMSLGLQYIHNQNILHRDLKPENILLTRHREIKIGDFGIARILNDHLELAETIVGTPCYLSPEICKKKPYSFESDIWSLGCILFEIASLSKVFQARDFFHLISLILKGEKSELPRHCSPFLQNLVNSLLRNDPEKRPKLASILHDLQLYVPSISTSRRGRLDTMKIAEKRNKENYVLKNIRNSCRRKAPDEGAVKRPKLASPTQKNKENRKSIPFVRDISRITYGVENHYHSSPENSGMSSTYKIMAKLTRPLKKSKRSFSSSDNSGVMAERENHKFLKSESDVLDGDVTPHANTSKFHLEDSDAFLFEPTPDTCSTRIISDSDFSTKRDGSVEGSFSHGSYQSVFNSRPDGTSASIPRHLQCLHSQCHRCMLNMFWQHRIRHRSSGSLWNGEELKAKLTSVFRDKFDHVYKSLYRDWNRADIGKTALQKLEGDLNYEQTQNLPLMMQMIQLDILPI